MITDKGIQFAWNTVVGVTFLAVLAATMVANRLIGRA